MVDWDQPLTITLRDLDRVLASIDGALECGVLSASHYCAKTARRMLVEATGADRPPIEREGPTFDLETWLP